MAAPARVQETPGWVRDQIPELLGLATALTGSPEAAADLVADTILRTPRQLARATAVDTADDELLALLVTRFLATRRRRTGGLATADRLDALSPTARVGVVLRDGIGMTPLTIASLLDRPANQVSAELDSVGSCADEVALLRRQAPGLDQLHGRLDAVSRRIRSRRRRLVALGAVLALLIGVAVSVPTFLLPRLPADVRPAGVWRFSHEVALPPNWTVTARTVTRTTETTLFQPLGREHDGCSVTVHTTGALDEALTLRPGESRVHGRQTLIGQDRNGSYLLAWEYGRQAWAQVSCATTSIDESLLAATAERVRFRPTPARLPYVLSALPEEYEVLSLTEYPLTGSTELHLSRDDINPGEVNLVIAAPLDQPGPTRSNDLTQPVAGVEWRLRSGTDPRICVDQSERTLCVLTYWPGGDWPTPAPDPVRARPALTDAAARIRLAESLPDQRTWFDAEAALPR